MGRLGISYTDVAQAALQLQEKQKNPTVDAIRQILGTGSKSTIARYLQEWKSHQGLKNSRTMDLPEDLMVLIKDLWERFKQECTLKIQTQEQHCQAAEKLNTQLYQTIQENQAIKKTLTQEQIKNARLSERIEASQEHLKAQSAEIKRLHQLLAHVQTHLEHYQSAAQKLREEHALVSIKQQYENQQQLLAKEQKIIQLQVLLEQT